MNPVCTIDFNAELISENSWFQKSLGTAKNTMSLYLHEGKPSGCIEWAYTLKNGYEDATDIGVWFDAQKNLIDYDGVFSLPKEAIKLLRKAGFHVGKEYEE